MGASLADRIRTALTTRVASAVVDDLIQEVKATLEGAEAAYGAAYARALDPSVETTVAQAAEEESNKLRFDRDRLKTAQASLETRLGVLQRIEADEAGDREYEAAREERDTLAKEIGERWPVLTTEMVDILRRLDVSDRRLAQVNCAGAEWLSSAEAVARGLPVNWTNDRKVAPLGSTKIPAFRVDEVTPSNYGLAWPNSSIRLVG